MLRNIIVSLFIIAMITTASSTANAQKKSEAKALRHVVLFKFKDGIAARRYQKSGGGICRTG